MSLRIRRGGFTGGAPPPPEAFGPLPSAQTIRDGARPSIVADPGGGITFTSRADLQAKINANPTNTLFKAAGGTTYDWDATISPGTKHPRIYFLGDPNTAIINGAGREITGIDGSNSGGEVHGGKWRNFGTTTEATGLRLRTGWLAEDVITENCFGIGIACQSDFGSMTVRRAITRNNGRYGLSATIDSAAASAWGPGSALFEDIEISGNNTRLLGIGGNAGGTKFSAGCHASTWRRIWAHDNYGSGLWWDGYHFNNLVEDIVSENNGSWGGFVELGFGSNIFQRWYLKNNCTLPGANWFNGVQFLVSCANGTQLGNLAANRGTAMTGGTGITFRDSIIDGSVRAMGAITHDTHPIDTKDVHFLHNQIWLRLATTPPDPAGQVGGQDTDSVQVLWNEIIEFEQNEYHIADAALQYWKWQGSQGDPRTWTEWRAFGKDVSSTMVVI